MNIHYTAVVDLPKMKERLHQKQVSEYYIMDISWNYRLCIDCYIEYCIY